MIQSTAPYGPEHCSLWSRALLPMVQSTAPYGPEHCSVRSKALLREPKSIALRV